MTLKKMVFVMAAAAVVGAFFDVVINGEDSLSARVWLGVAAAMVIAILLRELLTSSAVEDPKLLPVWSLRRPHRISAGPRGLENTHAVLLNAGASPRAFAIHLRPRLLALARHFLPLRQGIDVDNDPIRVSEKLGDVAWLIDATVSDRAPSMTDIERFLDLTLSDRDLSGSVLDNQPPKETG